MPLWTFSERPHWVPNAIQTEAGWVDPDTGELMVAISNLPDKREAFVAGDLDNLLLEDGGFLILQEDLQTDNAPDYITLDV